MGWGQEEGVRKEALEDPVLASLASAEERRVKRWDPLAEKGPEKKQVDPDKAKKLHERFIKRQQAAAAAAQAEEAKNRGHPSLAELRKRREVRAETQRAERERAERERAESEDEALDAITIGMDTTVTTPGRERRSSHESAGIASSTGIASSVTAQRLERSQQRLDARSGARSPSPESTRATVSNENESLVEASPPLRDLGELVTERDRLLAAGSMTDAESLMTALIERQRTELGDRHHDTLTSLEMYGLLLTALCRFKEALPAMLEAVNARREILGDEHVRTKAAVANLGHLQEVTASAVAKDVEHEAPTGKFDSVAAAKLAKAASDATAERKADEFFREFQRKVKAEAEAEATAKAEAERAKAEAEAAEAERQKAEALAVAMSMVGGTKPSRRKEF